MRDEDVHGKIKLKRISKKNHAELCIAVPLVRILLYRCDSEGPMKAKNFFQIRIIINISLMIVQNGVSLYSYFDELSNLLIYLFTGT
jgi:hypothetical protein